MITLKEIADRCNVSIATVSNILNGKSNFSEDTKQKILQVVKETGYRPNYMARTLRAHKTNTIGLIVDDLVDFSAPLIIDGLMGYCERNGFKIVLENLRYYGKLNTIWSSTEDYKNAVDQAIQEMMAIKVDGIIYIASHSRKLDFIPKNLDIPVVVSYAYSESAVPSVLFNDEIASLNMTNYLIEKGHKQIGLIMGTEISIHSQSRLSGFKKALSEHNISFNNNWYYYGNWDIDSGYDACKILIESDAPVSAIFCFNDLMAFGAYKYLIEHNLKPGVDISVVGFDDREVCRYMEPGLTTMRIPLKEIGETSADLLMRMINGEEVEKSINLQCEFIERDSVRNLNL